MPKEVDKKEEINKTNDKAFVKKLKVIKEKVFTFCKNNLVLPYTIIGITLFFLSLLLAAQMKSMSESESVLQGKRESELADELVTLQRKYNDLKNSYDENVKVVEEYQTNSATNNELISSMKTQINNLSALAGTTDLKGEGIIITLNDGTALADDTVRADTLVHDSDILTVVNELKAAGAEAISVNGQRIITTSAIRCVGPVIQVNYQKIAAPFEIKAIGNAQYLESAMTIKNGVVDLLSEYGVQVTVTRQSDIVVGKYEGTLSFKNAIVPEDDE